MLDKYGFEMSRGKVVNKRPAAAGADHGGEGKVTKKKPATADHGDDEEGEEAVDEEEGEEGGEEEDEEQGEEEDEEEVEEIPFLNPSRGPQTDFYRIRSVC